MDDRLIASFASTQLGLLTRSQAQAAGATDQAIKRRVDGGRWERVRPGVYRIGGTPPSWEQRVLAACLAAGEGTVAGRRTANRLWGSVDRSGRIELLVPGRRRVRLAGVDVHGSVLLPQVDVAMVGAIPVTSLSRTLVDASAGQSVATVGAWIDTAMRVHHLSILDLTSCVARLAGPGRRDLSTISAALQRRVPGYDPGDSDLELRALRALADAGLPAPVQQHPVRRPDGSRAFIDLAYPADLVAIELDGWEFHGLRTAFDRDRLRRNDLTLLGWSVYQFTSAMTGAHLATTIARALGVATEAS